MGIELQDLGEGLVGSGVFGENPPHVGQIYVLPQAVVEPLDDLVGAFEVGVRAGEFFLLEFDGGDVEVALGLGEVVAQEHGPVVFFDQGDFAALVGDGFLDGAWRVGRGQQLILETIEKRIQEMPKLERRERWVRYWNAWASKCPISHRDLLAHQGLYEVYLK